MRERERVGSYDEIVAAAVRTTGLDDFGDDTHAEGLRVLVQDYATHADLTGVGNARMRGMVKGLLVAKLMAQQALASVADVGDIAIERPIFVMGLPRSGTTLVQRLLSSDPAHQGLEQWLADLPQPRPPRETWDDHPIFSAMQAGYQAFHEANPELAGIHYSDAAGHEECWRLLQQAGTSVAFETQAYVPAYSEWLQGQSWAPAYQRHRQLLQLIGSNDWEKRWILKNPSHLIALDTLLQVYPDALLVITRRDPVTCVASMCSLAAASTRGTSRKFIGETIGRTQFDLLQRETAAFEEVRPQVPSRQIMEVEYDGLVADPVATMATIYDTFGMRWDDTVRSGMQAELDLSRSGPRAPRHTYSLADYGLSADEVRAAL